MVCLLFIVIFAKSILLVVSGKSQLAVPSTLLAVSRVTPVAVQLLDQCASFALLSSQ
jgi:hypothetical protein